MSRTSFFIDGAPMLRLSSNWVVTASIACLRCIDVCVMKVVIICCSLAHILVLR